MIIEINSRVPRRRFEATKRVVKVQVRGEEEKRRRGEGEKGRRGEEEKKNYSQNSKL
jgi:hypothetical protein